MARVVDVARHPETGYTAVKFLFNDTPSGHAAKRLVDRSKITELSLGHKYYPDTGRAEPTEISLCFKGARTGTRIFKEGEFDRLKSMSTADANVSNLATAGKAMEAPEPTKEVTEPLANESVNAKEKVVSDGGDSMENFLENISKNLPEKDRLKLWQTVGGMMETTEKYMDAAKKAEEKNKILEDAARAMSDNNNAVAANIVDVVYNLIEHYAGDTLPSVTEVSFDNTQKFKKKSSPTLTFCAGYQDKREGRTREVPRSARASPSGDGRGFGYSRANLRAGSQGPGRAKTSRRGGRPLEEQVQRHRTTRRTSAPRSRMGTSADDGFSHRGERVVFGRKTLERQHLTGLVARESRTLPGRLPTPGAAFGRCSDGIP